MSLHVRPQSWHIIAQWKQRMCQSKVGLYTRLRHQSPQPTIRELLSHHTFGYAWKWWEGSSGDWPGNYLFVWRKKNVFLSGQKSLAAGVKKMPTSSVYFWLNLAYLALMHVSKSWIVTGFRHLSHKYCLLMRSIDYFRRQEEFETGKNLMFVAPKCQY